MAKSEQLKSIKFHRKSLQLVLYVVENCDFMLPVV